MNKKQATVIAIATTLLLVLGGAFISSKITPVVETVIEEPMGKKPIEIKQKKQYKLNKNQTKKLEKNLEKLNEEGLIIKGINGNFNDEIIKQLTK